MYTPYSTSAPGAAASVDRNETHEHAIGLRDVVAFVRRYFRSIALFAAAFTTAALVYVLVTPPIFIATAGVIIDTNRLPGFSQDSGRVDAITDQARVENQIEIIKSERIAAVVISELGLGRNGEFGAYRESLTDTLRSWIALLSPGTEDDEAARLRAESIRRRFIVSRFADRLAVRRVGQSLVIEVAFSSTSPTSAAQIANAIADAYVRESVETKSQLAQRRGQWLSERLEELQKQSFDAARAVERFKLLGDTGPNADVRAKLAELESVSQSYRRMYDGFLQQYTETIQRVTYPEPDARIVSHAAIPLRKSHPKSALIVGFAFFLGVSVGSTYALMRTVTDRSVRSPRQLGKEAGVECLGAISRIDAPRTAASRRWFSNDGGEAGAAPLVHMTQFGMRDASSTIAMELRELRTSINAATIGRRSRCFGIVAPTEAEGATTVAAGLAHLYAMAGVRTLLVDACAHNPTLSREFDTGNDTGLMQALESAEVCAQLLADRSHLPLAFLPVGFGDAAITPGDRIGSERAAIQIEDFKEQFDLVVFDLPALSASPDARSIAPYLDGVILVVDAAQTTLDAVSAAVACLNTARGNVMGVVLNKVAPDTRRSWYQ